MWKKTLGSYIFRDLVESGHSDVIFISNYFDEFDDFTDDSLIYFLRRFLLLFDFLFEFLHQLLGFEDD